MLLKYVNIFIYLYNDVFHSKVIIRTSIMHYKRRLVKYVKYFK